MNVICHVTLQEYDKDPESNRVYRRDSEITLSKLVQWKSVLPFPTPEDRVLFGSVEMTVDARIFYPDDAQTADHVPYQAELLLSAGAPSVEEAAVELEALGFERLKEDDDLQG